jgi:hypothetical protein
MFDFDIMVEFGIYMLIDLFGTCRPWDIVSGAHLEHLELLQVH